jgi:hypothetical protein
MEREDQYRFEVDTIASNYGDAAIVLTCTRCSWSADIDDAITLADLNDRAAEHAEVCR